MKIRDKELTSQIVRYICISVFSYLFVFSFLYTLVDVFKVNESLSFLLVYGVAYLLLYSIQLKFLFKTSHEKRKLIKFILSIFLFYVVSNLLYNFFLYSNVNYLLSTAFTIAILAPLRFLISKYFVYK
ncbi:GtrA family protein [Xanthomarina sp.]|uniref:GtrA family protein n=1 Tax=Xanthomarina sp. TaxID=1931211 RepID=UPI0039C8EC8B